MTQCLLCGMLNNDDFERCSLCKTEPERVLRVLTESQRWVNVTLVTLVFLALASAVALDLYLAHRVIFHSGAEVENGLTDSFDPFMPLDGKEAPPGRPSAVGGAGTVYGTQIVHFILDFLLIALWLVISVGFVGGSMYATKRGTMWACNEVMRHILRGKVERNKYIFPDPEVAKTVHIGQAKLNVRGTL